MKARSLVLAALAAFGALIPSALGQVWAVQPALGRIITVDPATGTILNSFAAPPGLLPSHREIGLSIAEGDGTLLYHNSNVSPTTVYRLSPITGAIISVESRATLPIDGMSWQRDSSGQAYLYLSHFNDDVHRPTAFGGLEINNWEGPGNPRGGLGGDGHGREFMIAIDGLIYEYSPFSRGVNIRSFAAPSAGSALEGLAFDGVSLYAGDTAGNLFTLDPNTGLVQNTVTVAGGGLYGLAAAPPIVVNCPPGDVIEGEFESGAGCGIPVDNYNGGCNSVPPAYSPIECGDTVCGTGAFDGLIRDTDWYVVSVTECTVFTWTLIDAEFDWVIFILNDTCTPPIIFTSLAGPAGTGGSVTSPLLPVGTYSFVVAPAFNATEPCPSTYRARLECVPCPTVECQTTDIPEGELAATGDCGAPLDTFNGGCNIPALLYSPIACGDVICGTAEFDGTVRDTDWYRICLPITANYIWTLLDAEFDWVIAILDDVCPPNIIAFGSGAAFTPGALSACLPPGCYVFFVAPAFNANVFCPSEYRVELSCPRGACEGGADCNDNQIDDAKDIASGTSRDCFTFFAAPGTAGGPNGIPDECECIADWNRDGVSNSTDVSDFINTYFADQINGTLNADVNCDGVSNSTDVSDFINTWFAAQAGQLPFAGCTV